MDRIKDLSLDQKAKLYYMGLVKKGEIDTLPEDPKAAFVRDMMDKEKPQKEDNDVLNDSWTLLGPSDYHNPSSNEGKHKEAS